MINDVWLESYIAGDTTDGFQFERLILSEFGDLVFHESVHLAMLDPEWAPRFTIDDDLLERIRRNSAETIANYRRILSCD